MNETLQAKLVEIISAIQVGVSKTYDFALVQLPDIAQSYVLYGRVYTTFLVVLAIALVILVWMKACKWNMIIDQDFEGMPYVIATGISVIPILSIMFNLGPMLMSWFAPKVWLIKELSEMLK